MAKATLGEKQACPNCSAKFYDLNKRPATCPKCATVFDPSEDGVRLKRTRRAPAFGKGLSEDEDQVETAETSDDEEEEVEDTPELDADGGDDTALETDDDDDSAPEGDLPPGFSEEEADLEDDAVSDDDDDVPLIEDEEDFNEDELGEISNDDDEN